MFTHVCARPGSNYYNAIASINAKLHRQNHTTPTTAIPVQLPLIRCEVTNEIKISSIGDPIDGDFAGVIDLIAQPFRKIVYTDTSTHKNPVLTVTTITEDDDMYSAACAARNSMVAEVADVCKVIEEIYLCEESPDAATLKSSLRAATIANLCMPVLACAALKRSGVEPIIDAITHYLPSPDDAPMPMLVSVEREEGEGRKGKKKKKKKKVKANAKRKGDPLIALAFKVVHVKGRGGGDGRIVFARVFSGTMTQGKSLRCVNAKTMRSGEERKERPAALLEVRSKRRTYVARS